MAYHVSPQQKESFEKDGFLVLHDVLTASETTSLQKWAQEVHDWPISADVGWMPYEVRAPSSAQVSSAHDASPRLIKLQEVNASGNRVLCRTENYANYHKGFNSLLRGEKLLGVLGQLSGEPMSLFKEKINYKLAGSGMHLCV